MIKLFTKEASWETDTKALKTLPNKQVTLFACDVARLVLPIWEEQFPDDKRPRTAVETAELFVCGKATKDQLDKAIGDALDAGYASSASVGSKAWTAAWVSWAAAKAARAARVADAVERAADAARNAASAASGNDIVQNVFRQTTPMPIPITPTLQSIAENIIKTRKFEEYYVLLDNLEEVHNITLPREVPLGLSHYVLFSLTNTH